jgi:DNA-binding transcriptional MerR regulator
MEQSLFTIEDLCKRWNISRSTLDRWRKEKKIVPVSENPIRFNYGDILKVEGTDKMSAFERRMLEKKIEELKEENAELQSKNESIKKQLTNVMASIMPILQED